MVAGGGGKMVGPLAHLSGHGRGYKMVGRLACSFGWGGGCKIVAGGSGEGMGVGGCGEWGCSMLMDGGNVEDRVVVGGMSLSLSVGEGSSCVMKGGDDWGCHTHHPPHPIWIQAGGVCSPFPGSHNPSQCVLQPPV